MKGKTVFVTGASRGIGAGNAVRGPAAVISGRREAVMNRGRSEKDEG
jgi:NAD(P)-dependent dehydrogenase (short-subunit alcohol dehydrogenase family)